MLSEKEREFISFWEEHREREGKWFHQLLYGLPIGLLFSVPVIAILFTGKYWYKRADAVAHAKLNPLVLVIGVLIMSVFVAYFYRKYRWEMREQWYLELKNKLKKELESHSKV